MENRYDKYKDSGIAWIGEIPEHWELRKGKNLFRLRISKGNNNAILLAATQKFGMIPQTQVEGVVQVRQNTDLNTFRTVHKNDYVISLRSFQGGFEMSEYEGVCSPAYQVFYSKTPCCNYFFKYLFKSYGFISQINAFTLGIREGKNIQYEDFSLMKLPLPTLQEQQTIAAYLDQKCGEIDELITLQEEMITKLQGYKQSVITEAVTKGLDKNVPLKDSGIAWIGEIPEHWEIIKIKYILKNNSLKVGPFGSQLSGSDILSKGKYWIYNQRTVLDNNYSSCNSFISNEKYNDLIGFKVSAGDILLTTRGTIGKISRIPSIFNEGVIHPCIIRFNINEKILKYEILRYIFNDSDIVTNQVKYNSNSTTIDVIYSDTLKNIVLAYIPQKEQQSIADYLDQKCSEIDELISIKQQKIEKLKEYKKSLIFECVTGKRKVS